ncbi:MAG: LysE family transporter [Oscillospiraceae bacterium]|nr:LysE family transporter [Oscillospiraceae bacterium]
MIYLLKGVLIGIIFGVPAGAVGALCVQRTLQGGMKCGIITGLGSSAADCFYAIVGAFGITVISDFLTQYQLPINIVGGLLILAMGIGTLLKKQSSAANAETKTNYGAMFLSAFSVGITNPAAVLTFLFAFSYFGIDGRLNVADGVALVTGVLIGTLIWWITLSAIARKIKDKFGEKGFSRLNKIFGIIMIGFGVVVFARLIIGGHR